MQYNYFPGRLRFRDPVLRDSDIRNAALEVVRIICSKAEITYKESTASILAIYPEDAVNPDTLKPLVPLSAFKLVKAIPASYNFIRELSGRIKKMILTNEELKKIYFGAYEFEEREGGYIQAFQYSKKQIEYFKNAFDFWYERCTASTAKTFEFTTTARKLSYEYKIIWKGSPDSFEITVDGLVTGIKYVKDLMDTGTIEWELPEGEKKVVIYLPADATVLIRNFSIDAKVEPAVKGEKVLWLGDSITQGYGPLRSSCTYVSVANRLLNYDIINQGIGGYIYDKNSLMKMEGYNPDKIIVALGTNQYGDKDMTKVEEYYKTLMDIYGNDIPVLCISPIWRGDSIEGLPTLMAFCEKVKKIAGQYKNVRIVDGMKMIPHLSEYFLDNLHPNCFGCEVYGRNLVEEIRRLGF